MRNHYRRRTAIDLAAEKMTHTNLVPACPAQLLGERARQDLA